MQSSSSPRTFRLRASAFLALLVCANTLSQAAETLASPSGTLRIELAVDGDGPAIRAWYVDRALLEPSAIGVELPFAASTSSIAAVKRRSVRESWRPPYGEQAELPDHFNSIEARLGSYEFELRAYDHALALRYRVPEVGSRPVEIRQENTRFRFPSNSVAWALALREDLYGEPSPLSAFTRGIQAPLTLRTGEVYASLLEADTRDFPRFRLARSPDGAVAVRLAEPYRAPAPGPVLTPWRVLLVGAEAADLVRNQGIVQTLNPAAAGDYAWVRPGKVLSAVGNFPANQSPRRLETGHLLALVDWAAEQRFRHLQLDWGWNSTEKPWTDEERSAYRGQVPERFRDSGWEKNTTGALDRVANGYVPFRPNPKTRGIDMLVDLDLPRLLQRAHERDVGVSLYVNARWALPAQDMDRLFALYAKWGVAGLKPGFVLYGKQENSAFILRMIEAAARNRLWLNIHDEYLPDGSSRTYPHVLSCEAGAGAENKPTLAHDLSLPFTRGLAGPFDYTPVLFDSDRGNIYSLAYLLAFYNPAPVIRGGFSAWNSPGGRGGSEIELLRELPDTWDESRVLAADIGRHLVVARRSGKRWFIGAVSARSGTDLELKLDFLGPGPHRLVRFLDSDELPRGSATREVKTANSSETLSVRLGAGCGLAGWFEPTLSP